MCFMELCHDESVKMFPVPTEWIIMGLYTPVLVFCLSEE